MTTEDTWPRAYWDAVDQFYWHPTYLGLGSIAQSKWKRSGNLVCIDESLTNKSGPLYRRVLNSKTYEPFLRAQEETFNHVLDIALAIVPPAEIGTLVSGFTSQKVEDEYHPIGRSLLERFGFRPSSNITQHDCYLLGAQSIACLELKFDSPTSLNQLAKYMWLCLKEEDFTGKKDRLDLVYIAPGNATRKIEKDLGFSLDELRFQDISRFTNSKTNKEIARSFEERFNCFEEIASRMKISAISWGEFKKVLETRISELKKNGQDKTLVRLYEGLVEEISRHPLAKIDTLEYAR